MSATRQLARTLPAATSSLIVLSNLILVLALAVTTLE
jgi:hypothetical protein